MFCRTIREKRLRLTVYTDYSLRLLMYLAGCFEFIDQRTFFFKANSGSESES